MDCGAGGAPSSTSTVKDWSFDYEGYALPANNGLSLQNNGGSGHNFQVTLVYDLY